MSHGTTTVTVGGDEKAGWNGGALLPLGWYGGGGWRGRDWCFSHVAKSECQRVIDMTYAVQCVPALVQHAGITTTAAQRQRQSMHRDDKQLRLCVATANQHHRETYASRRQERQTMQGYNGATAGTTNASRLRRAGESMHRAQTMHCNGKSTAAK